MKLISRIYLFLKVFGVLMKKSKKKKLPPVKKSAIPADLIQIGSVSDSMLKATVSVKGNKVYINIDGFLNEFDAMLWAKHQSIIWNTELENHINKSTINPTLH